MGENMIGKRVVMRASHPHAGHYSDFTRSWCHWSNAAEPCPNNTVAEPIEDEHEQADRARY